MLDAAGERRIKDFVPSKFRGDAALLAPGSQMLQALTSPSSFIGQHFDAGVLEQLIERPA